MNTKPAPIGQKPKAEKVTSRENTERPQEKTPTQPNEKSLFENLLTQKNPKKAKIGNAIKNLIQQQGKKESKDPKSPIFELSDEKGLPTETIVQERTSQLPGGWQNLEKMFPIENVNTIKAPSMSTKIQETAVSKIESIISQVVEKSDVMKTTGSQEVRITIRNEVMENTSVQIRRTGSDLYVNFITPINSSQQAFLKSNTRDLLDALKRRPNNTSVSVEVNGDGAREGRMTQAINRKSMDEGLLS